MTTPEEFEAEYEEEMALIHDCTPDGPVTSPAENDAPRCEDGGHTFPPPVTSGMSCVCGLLVVDTRVTTAAVCALSRDGHPCGVCDIPPGSGDRG